MKLELKRIIIFCEDMTVQTAFYRDVLGLQTVLNPEDEALFVEFDAGGCRIALRSGGSPAKGKRAPKLAFYAEDVEETRAWLVGRGGKMGKVKGSDLQLCEGKDPEGNPFQLSNRP